MDTHTVEIVPIVLEKHPDADKLSIVKIYNFTVVVNTEDWKGVTKAAYVQPDSVLPDLPEYRFLKETGNLHKTRESLEAALAAEPSSDLALIAYKEGLAALEAKIDSNTKYLRITVKRLRGVMSMGMVLPAPEGSQIGDDVAELLGITHYEPPTVEEVEGSRKHTGDDVASAPPMVYAPKYDVESVYKYADCFENNELVYVTEKLDGQNARFVATTNDNGPLGVTVQLHAGSRTEWKKAEGGSNWWRVIDQNPWITEWCRGNPGKVLYGETYGWVQSLKYGAKQGQLFFRAFDVIDGMEYLDVDGFKDLLPLDIQRVPILGIMPFNFEKLKALADGPSLVPGANNLREGIVVKPLKERKHWKLGRVMCKMVSNAYLEKSAR